MEKIKSLLSNIYYVIITVFGIVVTILTFGYFYRGGKIADLLAKLSIAKTNEEVLKIEKEIVAISTKKDINEQEIQELNEALAALAQKKLELQKEQQGKTTEEIEDFWNNR